MSNRAGFWIRTAATVIDLILLGLIQVIVVAVLVAMGDPPSKARAR